MALLNASGAPVKMQSHTFQLDLPAEPCVMVGAPDLFKLIQALLQIMTALATGNPVAIINAIMALMALLVTGS